MHFEDNIRCIVARALFLDERAKNRSALECVETDDSSVNERLADWKKRAAKNQEEAFEDWLSWRNLDESAARECLTTPTNIAMDKLPEWAIFLQEVLQDYGCSPKNPLYPKDDPIPFETLYLPFAAKAKYRLRDNLSDQILEVISDELLATMLHKLVADLSNKSAGIFQRRFQKFRRQHNPDLMISALTGISSSDEGNARESTKDYEYFTDQLKEGAIWEVLEEYSATARILSTICLQWMGMMSEFLQRLHTDRLLIADTFFDGNDPGLLSNIEANFSDPHQNGRCVMQLTFESGKRLVYKPHDLQIDAAYAQLLKWLNKRSDFNCFKPVKVLPREGYGWAEFIEQRVCKNEGEARNYFRRAGGLLALSYVLKSSDLHYENIIAHGSWPVVVDMETVIQPILPSSFSADQNNAESGQHPFSSLNYSVLRTSLLPSWHKTPGQHSIDISGLGAEPTGSIEKRQWVYINTDGMTMEPREKTPEEKKNIVYLDDKHLKATDYTDVIVEGFCAIYSLIMNHRRDWLAPDGPLFAFTDLPLRFLYRNTDLYGAILNRSIQPPVLSEGIDRSLQIEMLSRPYLFLDNENGKPKIWPMFRQERQAIERLDIPMFTVYSDSTDLIAGHGNPVQDFFEQSAVDAIRNHLPQLSKADMELQCRLIRASFFAKDPPDIQHVLQNASSVEMPDQPPEDDAFLDEASKLAHEILEASLLVGNHQREWLTLRVDPTTEKLNPTLALFDLYNGKTGILCALGAIAEATNDEEMMTNVRSSTQHMCRILMDTHQMPAGYPIGGMSGIGAIIYGMLNLAHWTGSEQALNTAKHAADWLTPSLLQKDSMLDVMGGSAGALLSLLALYESTKDEQYLNKAKQAGNHLLESRITDELTGLKVWPFPHETARPLTGFSHGAAGIAYSLLTLDDRLNGSGSAFREAAQEAIAYERAVFDEQQCNWPDFRQPQEEIDQEQQKCMTAWCHGAPGISLSRSLMQPYLPDDDMLDQEIEAAVETTCNHPLKARDHLCCGNFGRIAILHTIGQLTNDTELIETAKRKTVACMQRAQKDGQYLFTIPQKGDCPNVSLFRGIGGVAYTLLQLARPGEYPSLLGMESPVSHD